jgi:hypothetical protein
LVPREQPGHRPGPQALPEVSGGWIAPASRDVTAILGRRFDSTHRCCQHLSSRLRAGFDLDAVLEELAILARSSRFVAHALALRRWSYPARSGRANLLP